MKIKIDYIKKYVIAFGFILFFINPSIALAADTFAHVEETEGTAWTQSTGEEVTAELRSDEISLQSTRHMRLQTIDSVIRSQQSSQRINVPHPSML